jgi:hypothetical protein
VQSDDPFRKRRGLDLLLDFNQLFAELLLDPHINRHS